MAKKAWTDVEMFLEDVHKHKEGLISKSDYLEHVTVQDEISTWAEFQAWVDSVAQSRNPVFRGHSRDSYRLETSLERAALRRVSRPAEEFVGSALSKMLPEVSERSTLLAFKRRAHQYLTNPPEEAETLEWLALMQHHGAPTRLLDWTFSPYVALFFALDGAEPEGDCSVWSIDSDWLIDKSHSILKSHDAAFPAVPDFSGWNRYLNSILFNANNPACIVMANPYRMNQRVAAQQGVFLCALRHVEVFEFSLLNMALNPTPISQPVLHKLVVKPKDRIRMVKELIRMNLTPAALFPGLDGLARSLRMDLELDLDYYHSLMK